MDEQASAFNTMLSNIERAKQTASKENRARRLADVVAEYEQEIDYWESAYQEEKHRSEQLLQLLIDKGFAQEALAIIKPKTATATATTTQPLPPQPVAPAPAPIKKKKPQTTFRDLIQTSDPDATLQMLHQRIDGKGGKLVAMILLKAREMKMIFSMPTEKQFRTEFTNITSTWHSISHYLNPNHPADFSSVSL